MRPRHEIPGTELRHVISRVERHRAPSARLALVTVAGLTLIYLISILYTPAAPSPDGQYFTICAFKNFTGLPCPGCGLTHSFCAIGKGDYLSALGYNLLGPPLFLLSIVVWVRAWLVLCGWRSAVERIDSLSARLKPVPLFAIGFALFGLGRILFTLMK